MSPTPCRIDALPGRHELPPLHAAAADRTTLALYCGASGDHNPIHVDIDFARSAGMPTCSRTACWAWPGWAGC
jgi:acyl dehydratase